MKTTVRIEGLKELDAALSELPKATARNVLRRVLTKAAQPMANDMRNMAPDDPRTKGKDLRNSIGVGTKLSPRQAKLHRRETKDDKAFAEVFVGTGPLPHAHMQEFGTVHHGPQPYARPAFDSNKSGVVNTIRTDLWDEIQRATQRLARKAARLAAKGK